MAFIHLAVICYARTTFFIKWIYDAIIKRNAKNFSLIFAAIRSVIFGVSTFLHIPQTVKLNGRKEVAEREIFLIFCATFCRHFITNFSAFLSFSPLKEEIEWHNQIRKCVHVKINEVKCESFVLVGASHLTISNSILHILASPRSTKTNK